MSDDHPYAMVKRPGRGTAMRHEAGVSHVDAFDLAGLGSRDRFVAQLGGRVALPIGLLLLIVTFTHLGHTDWLTPVVGVGAAGVGVVLIRWPDLVTLRALDVALVGADGLLVLLAHTDRNLGALFPGIYLVIGAIVFALRRWPSALFHLVLLGASFAGVLVVGPAEFAPVTRWLSVLVLITTEAFFIRWLVESIVVAAIAEHSARTLIESTTGELEFVNEAKTAFLADMSHELRTPLNAIKGFTDLIRTGLVGEVNERQSAALRDISDSSQHLVALVDDLLDIANIEAGGVRLNYTEVNVAGVLDESLSMVRERAAHREVECTVEMLSEIGSIQADRLKVRQVLVNLLVNAIKFTPPGGKVVLRAERRVAQLLISVIDTGPGIAPELREAIFEKFTSSPDSEGGTGLGLPISRALIEAHGGRLIAGATPGGGSTFRLALPLTPHASLAAPAHDDEARVEAPDYSALTQPGSPANLVLVGQIGARLTMASGLLVALAAAITPAATHVRVIAGACGGAAILAGLLLRVRTTWLTDLRVEFMRWFGIAAILGVDAYATKLHEIIPYCFAWLTMVSFALSQRRSAVAQLTVIAIALGVVTLIRTPHDAVSNWIAVVTLLAFNCEIIVWITARLRDVVVAEQAAYATASQVHHELTTVGRHKSAFVANTSHELRTPLNAIIGFADLLSSELLGPLDTAQSEYVRDIQHSARQLLSLINDVLDVARLEAGQLKLAPDVLNVRDLIQSVTDAISTRPVTVDIWVQPGLDLVIADRARLAQVLDQVVRNAIRFTPDGGRVDIRASNTAKGELAIAVTDTGIGFGPDELAHIFEPFRRGKRAPHDHEGGAGLGLSLVKGLIELHGGHVLVTSNDVGSTVLMTVPALMASVPA